MIYPFNEDCPTQPLIDIVNITLRNVTSHKGLLPAGIIRCNVTNPCTNITFENVNVKSFLWDLLGFGYITEFATGNMTNVHPDPHFLPLGSTEFPTRQVGYHGKDPLFIIGFLLELPRLLTIPFIKETMQTNFWRNMEFEFLKGVLEGFMELSKN